MQKLQSPSKLTDITESVNNPLELEYITNSTCGLYENKYSGLFPSHKDYLIDDPVRNF